MDIDRDNFWQTLPTVLESISLSDIVAFDLEMTGISANSVYTSRGNSEEAAYQRAVAAARTFQILQVGLTCLSYSNDDKGPQLLKECLCRAYIADEGIRIQSKDLHILPLP